MKLILSPSSSSLSLNLYLLMFLSLWKHAKQTFLTPNMKFRFLYSYRHHKHVSEYPSSWPAFPFSDTCIMSFRKATNDSFGEWHVTSSKKDRLLLVVDHQTGYPPHQSSESFDSYQPQSSSANALQKSIMGSNKDRPWRISVCWVL